MVHVPIDVKLIGT